MGSETNPVTLCLSSGKGGVGKTSVTVNLGWALAQNGRRVLLVDGDLGLANIDILLGLSVQKTIRDILQHEGDPLEALIYLTPNYAVLPASSGVPDMVALGPDDQTQLGEILQNISIHFDYVLLDTAAGIGSSVIWFNTFADHNIIIFTPDPTSITDAYALIKILTRDYGRNHIHLLLNFVSSEQEGLQTYQTLARVAKKFLDLDPSYLGAIPQDRAVTKAVRDQSPFLKGAPNSKAAQAILALADRVLAIQ